MPLGGEAIQEMNHTIKKALATKKFTQNLEFAKELISECMKLKVYNYFGREINIAYDCLMSMASNSRAMAFLVKDEELGKYWADDFFESIHNQGEYFRSHR